MNILLTIIAIAAIILSGAAALITPYLIGRDRGKYKASDVTANVIEFVVVLMLALRVLGII